MPLVAFGRLTLGLAGRQAVGPAGAPDAAAVTGENPGDVKYFWSDKALRLGRQRFHEGNFGSAQQYFQAAVERAPKEASARIGLAVS